MSSVIISKTGGVSIEAVNKPSTAVSIPGSSKATIYGTERSLTQIEEVKSEKLEFSLFETPGPQGFQGWSPVIGTYVNANNIYLKVIDWTGGLGVKPSVGMYLSATGYTTDINQATNIRGSVPGAAGDNVFVQGGVFTAVNRSCYVAAYYVMDGSATMNIPMVPEAEGAEYRLVVLHDNALGIAVGMMQQFWRPTSREVGSRFEKLSFESFGAFGEVILLEKGIYEVRVVWYQGSIRVYIF